MATSRPAPGENDLATLLRSLDPVLHPETYAFATLPAATETDSANLLKLLTGLPVQMLFRETEGWSVILPLHVADEVQLKHEFACKKVTLNVHSSLEAVGMMAAVASRLAKDVGVGVNPVSGFYHDHLFVPVGTEGRVVECLEAMARE